MKKRKQTIKDIFPNTSHGHSPSPLLPAHTESYYTLLFKMADRELTKEKSKSLIQDKRTLLVCLDLPHRIPAAADSLEELQYLTQTAGACVVGVTSQRRSKPHAATCLGKGKIEEIKDQISELSADVVVFDNDLTPAQIRNLEEILETPVMDRTDMILEIFSIHARSQQAKLQVELARLEYSLPRLKRMWTHLSRIEKGIRAGAGEKQLEIDRRLARDRIARLKRLLKETEKQRKVAAKARKNMLSICLVGYTNAGKTTLLNRLTQAEEPARDELFVTLDTRTRRWKVNRSLQVLLSDTVGFINHLPHHLVDSFYSTLEAVREADLLLHVVDAASSDREMQIQTVKRTLEEIGCGDIPSLVVFNQIDRISDPADRAILKTGHTRFIGISALTGAGMEDLIQEIIQEITSQQSVLNVCASYANGKLIAFLNAHGQILTSTRQEDGLDMQVRVPVRLVKKIKEMERLP